MSTSETMIIDGARLFRTANFMNEMTNDKRRQSFGHSDLFRHSTFVLRHSHHAIGAISGVAGCAGVIGWAGACGGAFRVPATRP